MSGWRVFVLVGLALGWSRCGGGDGIEAWSARIAAAEAELAPMLQQEDIEVSEETETQVRHLLREYAAFANAHHGDSLAFLYSMRRADLLLGKGDAEAAVQQWIDVVEGGSGAALASEAMFRVGLTRETALADTVGALKAYAELLRLYPESPWAGPAGEAAKWLTFSEREFIRALESGTEARH